MRTVEGRGRRKYCGGAIDLASGAGATLCFWCTGRARHGPQATARCGRRPVACLHQYPEVGMEVAAEAGAFLESLGLAVDLFLHASHLQPQLCDHEL